MIKWRRGEIEAILSGKKMTLCLTLGALCSWESLSGKKDLSELLRSFEEGTVRAEDLLNLLTAGLQGGGHAVTKEEVSQMVAEGGLCGLFRLAHDLLAATFQDSQRQDIHPQDMEKQDIPNEDIQRQNHKKKAPLSPGKTCSFWDLGNAGLRRLFFGR